MRPVHSLLRSLRGGDRRSIGVANDAARAVLENPQLLGVLFAGLASNQETLRMRCADAIEKATRAQPHWLQPFKRTLLGTLATDPQKEVRWHVAALLTRLNLSAGEEERVYSVLLDYCNDPSSIVKTQAMQGLTDLAVRHPRRLPEVRRHIEELMVIGTPAMKARARKLLQQLCRAGTPTTDSQVNERSAS